MKLDELPKQLFFSSSEELIDFARQNGLHLEVRKSKSSKIEMIHWVGGQLSEIYRKCTRFIKNIENKRHKKYYLNEEMVVEGDLIIRSFFVFGDFKEGVSSEYVKRLLKKYRYWQRERS